MTTVLLFVLVVVVVVYLRSILKVLRQIATSLAQTIRETRQPHRDLPDNSPPGLDERKDGQVVSFEPLLGPIEEIRKEVAATRAWFIERNAETQSVKAAELLAAVRKGDENAIESIATSREISNRALLLAVQSGTPEDVETLLGHGADVNSADSLGWSVLKAASVRGHATIAKILIDAGAEVDQGTALHTAIRHWRLNDRDPAGRLALIELLFENGASLSAEDEVGDTPLMAAARDGRADMVEKLCALGANANGKNHNGDTALMAAMGHFHGELPASLESIKILLRNGADVNLSNKDGKSPLLAAAKNQQPEAVQILLDSGADVSAKDSDGCSVLMYWLDAQPRLRLQGFWEPLDSDRLLDVTRLLLAKGADPNGVAVFGWTALKSAVGRGDLTVVRELLNAGADVNAPGKLGGTPLALAAATGHLTIVEELLNAGAEVNVVGGGDGTALTAAAGEGHLPIVQVLLARGADPRIVNKRWQNALDVVEAKRSEIETERNESGLGGWGNDDYRQYETKLQQLEAIERELTRALHAAVSGFNLGTTEKEQARPSSLPRESSQEH